MKVKFFITDLSFVLILFAISLIQVNAQNVFPSSGSAGIGTTLPNSSSALEIKSTTQGLLLPRMTRLKRDAIATPANGLLIYQTNSTPGFYYFDGAQWQAVTPSSANTSLSNLKTVTAINSDLLPDSSIKRSIGSLTAYWKRLYIGGPIYVHGRRVLQCDTVNLNTYIGALSGTSNSTGFSNTALGYAALYSNTSGFYNTVGGHSSLYTNTTGSENTAFGYRSLFNNTEGSYNTATGDLSMFTNSTGYDNTANGTYALYSNTTGFGNTATGRTVLYNSTTGWYNTASGYKALYANTTGALSTAMGANALVSATSGNSNTAFGYGALFSTTTGNHNVGVGIDALYTNATGSDNTGIGHNVNVTSDALSNATAIGSDALVNASNKVRIGDGNVTVVESAAGSWTTSDGRFKNNITDDVKGLDFINLLKPVVYNFDVKKYEEHLMQNFTDSMRSARMQSMSKSMLKTSAIRQSGFIAQDVEVAAKKAGYNFNGIHTPENATDNYSLSYEKFVVPLVKAVQQLSSQNDSLKNTNALLQLQMRNQQSQIDELTNIVKLLASKNGITIASNNTTTNEAKLEQNIPNPFSGSTTINYYLPKNNGNAFVNFYGNDGAILKSIKLSANGKGTLNLKSNQLPSGTYQYAIVVDGKIIDSKQMVQLK